MGFRMRVRSEHVFSDHKERHGSRAFAHHWHRSRAVQNRNDEPRLQHAPLSLSGKDGGGGRMNRRATRRVA